MQQTSIQQMIIDQIDSAKGTDIIVLDLRGKSTLTDFFIIATGTSSRHVMSIADKVGELAKNLELTPSRPKHLKDSDWVVLDLGDIIVHIMQQESRDLYRLERLFG